jgi:hypothetical protein
VVRSGVGVVQRALWCRGPAPGSGSQSLAGALELGRVTPGCTNRSGGRCQRDLRRPPTPAALTFCSQTSPFPSEALAQGRVTGMGVTPAQVGVQPAGQDGVVGMVGVVQHEVPQRTEVTFDRV